MTVKNEDDNAANSKMRAIVYNNGQPKLVWLAIPTVTDGEVLVRVHAAGVNPVDAKNVFGDKLPDFSLVRSFASWSTRHCVPGFDLSGVVVRASGGFRPGDRVYGTAPPFRGSFCEYQRVPLDQIARSPADLSFSEAAVLPLTGLTVRQSLSDDVNETSHLLVIGASGGTGHFAIPYAKRILRVPMVVGICSTPNVEWVQQTLGADVVIDYKREWQQELMHHVQKHGPFTHVLDTVAGRNVLPYESFLRSSSLLQGRYIALGGGFYSWTAAGIKRAMGINLFAADRELFWVRFPSSSEDLNRLREHVETSGIGVCVTRTLPLTEDGVKEAFAQLQSRHTRGKIVLEVIENQE